MVTPVKPAQYRHGLGRLAFVAGLAAIALTGAVPAAAQSPASLGAVTIGSNYSDAGAEGGLPGDGRLLRGADRHDRHGEHHRACASSRTT